MSDRELLSTVSLFYDAVLDDDLWHAALRSLVNFCGGHAGGLISANPSIGKIKAVDSIEVPPEFLGAYCGYYSSRDVRLEPSLSFRVGAVITEDVLLSRRELRRSEIYCDLLAPSDFPHVMFSWLEKKSTSFMTLAIEGSKQHGAFEAEAMRRLQEALPHVMRSMRIRSALGSARQQRAALLDAINSLPLGVIFLDESTRPLWMNTEAELLVRSGTAITTRAGYLRAAVAEDDCHLQSALSRLLNRDHSLTAAGEIVALRRRQRTRTGITITMTPIDGAERLDIPSRAAAMLMIVDPSRSALPKTEIVARALNLTPAEAILAQVLFNEPSLREAAAALNISINTAKTQLKAIYAKTGCNSRASLAKAMLLVFMGQARDI